MSQRRKARRRTSGDPRSTNDKGEAVIHRKFAGLAGAQTAVDLYELFGPTGLTSLRRRIAEGEHISGPELAAVLRANPGRALEPPELDYVCQHLEGTIKKPRGRKRAGPTKRLRETYAAILYERTLRRLQARAHRLPDRTHSDPDHWWQGPPHERAARMVAYRFRRGWNVDWRHIQNLVSSFK